MKTISLYQTLGEIELKTHRAGTQSLHITLCYGFNNRQLGKRIHLKGY